MQLPICLLLFPKINKRRSSSCSLPHLLRKVFPIYRWIEIREGFVSKVLLNLGFPETLEDQGKKFQVTGFRVWTNSLQTSRQFWKSLKSRSRKIDSKQSVFKSNKAKGNISSLGMCLSERTFRSAKMNDCLGLVLLFAGFVLASNTSAPWILWDNSSFLFQEVDVGLFICPYFPQTSEFAAIRLLEGGNSSRILVGANSIALPHSWVDFFANPITNTTLFREQELFACLTLLLDGTFDAVSCSLRFSPLAPAPLPVLVFNSSTPCYRPAISPTMLTAT